MQAEIRVLSQKEHQVGKSRKELIQGMTIPCVGHDVKRGDVLRRHKHVVFTPRVSLRDTEELVDGGGLKHQDTMAVDRFFILEDF